MKLSLGFSPCPNDTFIFDALIHNKLPDTHFSYDVTLADVEALNQAAFRAELDITKLSFHAYAHVTQKYQLLNTGSALGRNVGPLLIAKKKLNPDELNQAKIAIPGRYTTANFLLSLAYPKATQKYETLFSEIENDVISGKADAGLIIHENRFTYQDRGLVKIQDLGTFWESTTGHPIPLGGIVIKRDLPDEVKIRFEQQLQASVVSARQNPEQTIGYVRAHAQEMEEKIMFQHIGLYVNEFTEDLGDTGRQAVRYLFSEAQRQQIIPPIHEPLFVS
ncbi:MAG: 1,4-dihydroxy-6-naphthoate synthase [Saprospiraceae bacterium]|nr:1,4-dihydroxy-6-naphthoate synthase [Saprospiraceae bacterium]